jgi:hypothetical protein
MTKPSSPPASRILPALCVLLTGGLLFAGLVPFNPFPRNRLTWAPGGQGLHFGDHGVAYTSAPLDPPQAPGDSYCSLQIRLQPEWSYSDNSGTIVNFYTPQLPWRFRLMQWHDELLIRRDYFDAQHHLKTAELELQHAFLREEPVFITIVAGPKGTGTVAYRDGVVAGSSSRLGLSCADFAGQLVLGESPILDNPWHGTLFDFSLSRWDAPAMPPAGSPVPASAARQLEFKNTTDGKNTFAHYAFSEGAGKSIHSADASAPDLQIPKSFVVLHKEMLLPPWKELPDKLTVRDIAINIAGFIPFGFLFHAYLVFHRPSRHAAWIAVLGGFAISLTIEVLQAYIPSRTSGMLDVFTNTLGTYLGVVLFGWPPMQNFVRVLGLYEHPELQPPNHNPH